MNDDDDDDNNVFYQKLSSFYTHSTMSIKAWLFRPLLFFLMCQLPHMFSRGNAIL